MLLLHRKVGLVNLLDIIGINFTNVDVMMHSPPNSPPRLRGASRVVGGFARGCALGNVFNLADAHDVALHDLGPTMGKVYLYFCNVDPGQHDLASVKPSATVKCTVGPTVGPVLKTIARKFSPIRGEYSVYYLINFNCS